MYILVHIIGLLMAGWQPNDAVDLGVYLQQEIADVLSLAGRLSKVVIIIDHEEFRVLATLLTPYIPSPATKLIWESDIAASLGGLLQGCMTPALVSRVAIDLAPADPSVQIPPPVFSQNAVEVTLSTAFVPTLSAELVAIIFESAADAALSHWTLKHYIHTVVVAAERGQPTDARLCATVEFPKPGDPDVMMEKVCQEMERDMYGFDPNLRILPLIRN